MRRAGPERSRNAGGLNWAGGKRAVCGFRLDPSLSFLTAPRAAPGLAKRSGAPVQRSRRARAKASQALKLRNSAKGKVPKSALGELGRKTASALQGWGQHLPDGAPNVIRGKGKKTVKMVGNRFRTQQPNSQVWALCCLSLLLSAI